MKHGIAIVLGLGLVFGALACGDDGDTADDGSNATIAGPGSSGGDDSTGPAPEATGTDDAASTGEDVDLCAMMDAGDNAVGETQMNTPYPDPAGGVITDGVYELIRFEVYAPAMADEHVRRRRLVVQGNTLVSIDQDDADPVAVTGGTFSVAGTELAIEVSCPTMAAVAVPFTATGDEVWLFDPSEPNLQVYARL